MSDVGISQTIQVENPQSGPESDCTNVTHGDFCLRSTILLEPVPERNMGPLQTRLVVFARLPKACELQALRSKNEYTNPDLHVEAPRRQAVGPKPGGQKALHQKPHEGKSRNQKPRVAGRHTT